ncbi:MAG: sirohydrochlorin cobaltochelatase, partial [Bacillota bacterium]
VLKRELTLPEVSQTVILTRKEGRTPVPSGEKLALLAAHNSSMAIFLSIHMIQEVVQQLIKSYPIDTPVAVVYKVTWPEQKIIRGNLGNIAEKVKKSGINKTALILVGDFLQDDYSYSKLYDKNFSHSYRRQDKKAILPVSFGTTYPGTRKLTIKACENSIKSAFPEFTVRRAFSSQMVINKIKKREGIAIDNPKEALDKLKEDDFSKVIVQPLFLIPGTEYHKLKKIVKKYKKYFSDLKMGKPLFYKNEDYKIITQALQKQIPDLKRNEAVLFAGHGSKHPANSIYTCLDYYFKNNGFNNIWVGTVEGYPEIDSIVTQLKKQNIKKVILIPLMMVAGNHVQKDMVEKKDSWKNVLENQGFKVEVYFHGLGENKEIQKIYVDKVKAIAGDFR